MKNILLIVEDDAGIQDVYRMIFEREGYEVQSSYDGETVMNDTFIHPDVILMDSWLGQLDGLDICRHLKANENTRSIPVIMVSATMDIVESAKDAGAEAALEKPIDLKQLTEVVNHWADATPNHLAKSA